MFKAITYDKVTKLILICLKVKVWIFHTNSITKQLYKLHLKHLKVL